MSTRCWKQFGFVLPAMGLALVLTACGQTPSNDPAAPPRQESPAEQTVSLAPPPVPVSAETRQTYQWYCAQCHGVEGKGNGINAKWMTVPPLDHTKPDYLETRSDQELFDSIKFGGLAMGRAPCMPAWGHTLDETMIRSLVRYIRELCQCEAA